MALTVFRAGPNWVHFSTTSKRPIQRHSAIARRNELEAALRVCQTAGEGYARVQGQPVDTDTVLELLRLFDANAQPTLF